MTKVDPNRSGVDMTDSKPDWMPEAEVSLRIAFWLLDERPDSTHADVAIDGAHVRIAGYRSNGQWTQERTICDVAAILYAGGCTRESAGSDFRGTYVRNGKRIGIRSRSGPDVIVTGRGRTVAVECKGGPLKPTKGKSAATIVAAAVGQLVTSGSDADELLVAVPDTAAFEHAARRAMASVPFAKTCVRFSLVGEPSIRLLV